MPLGASKLGALHFVDGLLAQSALAVSLPSGIDEGASGSVEAYSTVQSGITLMSSTALRPHMTEKSPSQEKTLAAWEHWLEPQVRQVELLGELGITAQECAELGDGLWQPPSLVPLEEHCGQ